MAIPADTTDERLLLLHPADTILVARELIPADTVVQVMGVAVRLGITVPRGHKVARRAIAPGDKILKYGAPIGSAVAAIAPGEHVHVHNIKSDYTATHLVSGPAQETPAKETKHAG
jgi:hypothetical protein